MHENRLLSRALCASAAGAGLILAAAAGAQDVSSDGEVATLGEVVVTSTKLGSTRVMDTPVSINAITGDMMRERGVTDFNDYMTSVPGLSAWEQGPGNKRYVLRGINGGTGAGTVGLYVDEITITGEDTRAGGGQQPDVKMFDMERLEVIKGPQSTTFGSSSMAGTIRYITKKPELSGFGGYIKAGMTAQEHSDIGASIEGALNLPLVEDKFAVRLSAYFLDQPGYIDGRQQKDVNNEDTKAARVQALWRVTDRLDLSAFAMYQELHVDGGYYYNKTDYYGNPLPKYQTYFQEKTPWVDESKLFNITGTFDTGVGVVTATASRNDRWTLQKDAAGEVMAFNARLPMTAAEEDGVRSILMRDKDRVVDTYELRFASEFSGPVQALFGVIRQIDERVWSSTIPTVNSRGEIDPSAGTLYGPLLQDRGVLSEFTEDAIFGQATWSINDQWTLTAGLRWFEVTMDSQSYVLTGTLGAPGTGFADPVTSKESSTIGRVNLSYKPTPSTLLYAEVGEGFRVGGTNDPSIAALSGVTIPDGYKSDSLINYELGYKATLLGGAMTLTAAAFYIDWSDMQVQLRTPTTPAFSYIGNANASEVYGAELEMQYRVTSGLTLGTALGYTDAQLVKAVTGGGVKGDQIPYTAKYTVGLNADYRWTLSSDWELAVGGDVNWRSKRVSDFPRNGRAYRTFDAYETVNLYASVGKGDWLGALKVRNLLNDDTIIDYYAANVTISTLGWFETPKRMVSLSLERRF